MRLIAVILVVAFSGATMGQNFGGHALFVRTPNAKLARQQSETNAYLPPFSTQRPPEKPRPFQPSGVTSFPRPSSLYTPPNTGSYPGSGQPGYSTPRPSFPSSQQPSSTYVPQGFSGSTSYNPPRQGQPSYSNAGSSAFPPLSSPESSSTYLPPQPPSIPSTTPRPPLSGSTNGFSGNGYPSSVDIGSTGGYSPSGGTAGTLQPPVTGGFSTPGGFSTSYGYPSERPTPSFPTPGEEGEGYPSSGYPSEGSISTGYPSTPGRPFPPFTTPGEGGTPAPRVPETGTTGSASTTGEETAGAAEHEDLNHPPHIHNLDVECSKTMMTINIEFNRAFDGLIYSKGFYMNPECRYVEQNSGQTQYSFTVNLDSCGTQFINDFEGEAGQAYLENVLVLQNEPGIQEVWDTVRRVRCLWEGNINKALTVNFSVDMLNQEIVTFSGDTATAKLDIQIGKGPFAPAADGLVKIGETMTLVVSVEGDPGFDLQVRDCVARDEASTNMLQLTDERGCILKPKLFGAFQKTNDTGSTGASIIAYAFFQAFKFPDVMDLFIECNVELCKTDCEPCPEADQQIEPGRRRRSVTYTSTNTSNPVLLSDPVRVGRRFKVIMLDDLSTASNQILESMEETAVETMIKAKDVCMSNSSFYTTFSLMLSTLFVATISAAVFYIKLQRIRRTKIADT
ncbi:uncharacterized protein [Anoplolepis gracilipes]|uniref:uncharacterized protein isoform X2 n=1 Tax=Anoplolepis gracilipes TaxID=354296 RepID=UPI003B9F6D77